MFKFLNISNRFINTIKRLYGTETIKKNLNKYKIKENSLERRFLLYLKKETPVSSVIIKTNTDINNLNNQQLLQYISNVKTNSSLVRMLDMECRKRLESMDTTETFMFLHKFTDSYPELVTKLPFYEHSLNKLNHYVHSLNKEELIQLCYYTGLKKKSTLSQQIIKNCLNKLNMLIDSLTTEDLVIICNSAFKTSTKIHQKKILEAIKNKIYKELSILSDEAFFVTIVKSLRHNQNYDDELLVTLSTAMFFNRTIQTYNFTALVHILALYADGLYYDENLLKFINKKSLEFFKNAQISSTTDYFEETVRIKDLCRYLWGLSYLGYDLSFNNIELRIVPIVQRYLKMNSIDRIYEDLFGCCLAFAFFGYYPMDVIEKILTYKISGNRNKSFKARKNMLLTCLQLEKPQFFNSLRLWRDPQEVYNIMGQVHKRPYLAVVFNCMKNIKNTLGITKIEFTCQIPHLSIVGIRCYTEETCKLHIECVDDETCVKNTEYSPNGSMKLKLRLLRTFKQPILRVNQNEINDMSEEELQRFLTIKIKRLL